MNYDSVMYFVIDLEGELNGWMGFASAESVDGLFQIVDATVDPYSVVMIENPKNTNICFRIGEEEDYDGHEIIGVPFDVHEMKKLVSDKRTFKFYYSQVDGSLGVKEVRS